MRLKYQRKRRTIPMACNSRSYRNRETTSLLPSITYFFLASNSIGAAFRAYSRGDYSMVAFIVFIYSAFLLLEFFLSAYHRLPPHKKSRKKVLLKYAIWFSFSAIMFGVALQFAPFFSLAAGLSLYAISALGSAFLFYIYIIYDETVDCAECSREEKRKSEKVTEKKTQHYYDSILEKV